MMEDKKINTDCPFSSWWAGLRILASGYSEMWLQEQQAFFMILHLRKSRLGDAQERPGCSPELDLWASPCRAPGAGSPGFWSQLWPESKIVPMKRPRWVRLVTVNHALGSPHHMNQKTGWQNGTSLTTHTNVSSEQMHGWWHRRRVLVVIPGRRSHPRCGSTLKCLR